jgi:hypothetical protein
MFEIDGTSYLNRSNYKRCLEKLKTRYKRNIRTLLRIREQTTDPDYIKLIEEAHQRELENLAYAHFNIAWLNNPDVFKHYPANIKNEESEG